MSSIMRRRNGLMALSVMGDAPVLMEVANPSSQDRTPRRAIVLAASPAAANYRASGLVHWHFSDLVIASRDVRLSVQSGPCRIHDWRGMGGTACSRNVGFGMSASEGLADMVTRAGNFRF